MAGWGKWLWGGLGWAVGGPIGGIIGFALGAIANEAIDKYSLIDNQNTSPGDFGAALLILCGAVMKSDGKLLKSELDYVRSFFVSQFGEEATAQRMLLFREILKQDYSMQDVCEQIEYNLDYASRLQLLHLLFGVSNADGEVHTSEINTIAQIAQYLHVEQKDFLSIKAMFVKDTSSAYRILEIEPNASDEDVKKAYRRLAVMHHPDKVHHLGEEFQKSAQEKFRQVNDAYDQIKKQRNMI